MYLTSLIHCEELFRIAERWLCGKVAPSDAMQLTRIFICDGYVLGETLEALIGEIIGKHFAGGFRTVRIRSKGELRDALCYSTGLKDRQYATTKQTYIKNVLLWCGASPSCSACPRAIA